MKTLISLILLSSFFSLASAQSNQVKLLADLNKETAPIYEPWLSFTFQDKLHYYTFESSYNFWVFDGKERFKDTINFEVLDLVKLKDSIVFLVSGSSIWKYNGLTKTRMANLSAVPENLTWYKNQLYFTFPFYSNLTGLWYLNEAGDPVKISDLSTPYKMVLANNNLYAAYKEGSIWTYNGNDPVYRDTNFINVNYATLTSFQNQLIYASTDSIHGTELWKYNGKEQPVLIEDLNRGISSSYPSNPIEINDQLYFMADTGSGNKLIFKYNGNAPPEISHDFDNCPFDLTLAEDKKHVINKKLYAVYDYPNSCCKMDLWVYDGINLPRKIASEETSDFYGLTEFMGNIYFRIHQPHIGGYLLMTDGLNPPTDAWLGVTNGSDAFSKVIYNNKLYFFANDGKGYDLWFYDGTHPPEIAVNLNAVKSDYTNIIISKNSMFLVGPSNIKIYNGTADLKDISIWGENDPDSSRFLKSAIPLGNGIFYDCKRNNDNFKYLWYLSADGTKRLIAENLDQNSKLSVFKNNIYFTGIDRERGKELYAADSSGNSHLAADIFPGPENGNPVDFIAYNQKLFFKAQDRVDSMSLWSYDGITTPAKIKSFHPNWYYLKSTVFKGKLYFQLSNGLYSYDQYNSVNKVHDAYFRQIYPTSEKLFFLNSNLLYEYDGINPVGFANTPVINFEGHPSFYSFNQRIYYNFGAYLYEYHEKNNPEEIFSNIQDPVLFGDKIVFNSSTSKYFDELFVMTQSDTVLHLTGCNTYCYNDSCYTKTGIYYDTIPDQSGKDSIVMFKIHINADSDTSFSISSCSPLQSPGGGQIWAKSGIYADTIPNSCGCDSVITINLTINQNSEHQFSESSCDTYISPGGKILDFSGIYVDTIPNSCGCDSIITIDLHVDHVDTSVIISQNVLVSADLTARHQWIDCDNGNALIPGETYLTYSPDHNGRYALIVTQGVCADTSSAYQVIITGDYEISPQNIYLYPNPSNGRYIIDLGKTHEEADVKIMTTGGQVIHHNRYTGIRKTEILIDEPPGMYLIRITTGDGQTVLKVFKI